jgi:hypothetical protein
LESGSCYVSTRAISRSSEQPRFRQLPKNMVSSKSWGLKFSP